MAGIEAPAAGSTGRDPRLDQLGLVYDDTIVTTSARTVDFNEQAVVPRYVRVQKGSAGKGLTVDIAITKVVLGVNPNFTVSLAVSYASKRLKQAGGATLRSDSPQQLLRIRGRVRADVATSTELTIQEYSVE